MNSLDHILIYFALLTSTALITEHYMLTIINAIIWVYLLSKKK